MKRVEKETRPTTEYIVTPNTALCRICKLQMSDACEDCLENKMDRFEPKSIPFAFLRTFTMEDYEELPNGAKGKLLAYYVMRIMEQLNGYDTR
jgi:hypothetical protein